MNRYLLAVAIWLAAGIAFAAVASLQYFHASPEGTDIRLDWEVDNENGLVRFELSRKLDTDALYTRIATVAPNTLRRYSYVDSDLFRISSVSQRTVYYKLQVISSSGEASFYTTVAHNPNAVQRSWGSIKSMFR